MSKYRLGPADGSLVEMQKIHRKIKGILIKGQSGVLMDFAAGSLNDLQNWNSFDEVYAIEIDIDSISKGFSRYNRAKMRTIKLPEVEYIHANLEMEDLTIKFPELQGVADCITCNFAFHYFLRNQKSIDNVINMINFFLRPGGHFIMTGLHGPTIWKLLKNNDILHIKKGQIDMFRIEKKYQQQEAILPYGETIIVYVKTIGIPHIEFLINPSYITSKLVNFTMIKKEMFTDFDRPKLRDYERKYSDLNFYMHFIKKIT